MEIAGMAWNEFKLYGVGPVDNRPSTDKLQQIVKKNVWQEMERLKMTQK